MVSTAGEIQAVRESLSTARMSTYETATKWSLPGDPSALNLYAWNAQMSAALLVPLHICEVVIRNAVSDALTATYGPLWPWNPTFERSLPSSLTGYCQTKDLQLARRRVSTVGKVIPELKFIFWQKMFTGRHDVRLWDVQLRSIMPNAPATESVSAIRLGIHANLEQIRLLRNRIAHHEPIFSRNLVDDIATINKLVMLRCQETSSWMQCYEQATALLAKRP